MHVNPAALNLKKLASIRDAHALVITERRWVKSNFEIAAVPALCGWCVWQGVRAALVLAGVLA